MAKQVVALFAVLMCSGALALAQQKPRVEKGPIQQTSSTNGREMFVSYCATCHGLTGTGDGPAAAALKKTPADLTRISVRNGGQFPAIKVSQFIEGQDELAAHGSRDMPIWGTLFKSLNVNNPGPEAQIRVHNLVEYLKSIQK